MSVNWKQKLSSRKFWAAVIGFITALGAVFGVSSMTTEQITAVISAIGILAAYIIGESCIDASRSTSGTKSAGNTDAGNAGNEQDKTE
jgi:uncharacterized membrane protein